MRQPMITLRPPVLNDAGAVSDVLVARDVADLGVPDYTHADLLDDWRAAEFSLEADARVAELDGRIVAYVVVRRAGTLAVVAPDSEGRGIGTELLRWAERRDRQQGRTRHRQWIGGGNQSARSLLLASGYARSRSHWRMELRLDGVERPAAPPGLALRELDVNRDAHGVHAVDALSFASVPDYQPMSFDAFRDEELGRHDVDPGLSVVAEMDGELAGFLLARRWPARSTGFVEILAVAPAHQRHGIGPALLRQGFYGFARTGLARAELGVASDNPRALRLYERLGMTARFRFDTYERAAP